MKPTSADIEKSLIDITEQFLKDSGETFPKKVTLSSSLQQHLGIDSLGRAELFSRIEKKHHVQIPQQLLAEANTLSDILNAVISASPQQQFSAKKIITSLNEAAIDLSSAKTLMDVLETYAKQTPDRPHIYLQDEYGKEEIITYGKLYERALCIANVLEQQYQLKPGDTVAIMLPTSPGFFYTFFGVLFAGCIPVPIYPPFRPHQIEAYAKQEAKILQNAEARLLITFHQAESLSKILHAFIPSLKDVININALLQNNEQGTIVPRNSDDFALIQYTSGSTNIPKGVLLTHQNLLSNIRAYGKAIAVTPKDVAISWVPLYHDLGLIGMWFGSLYFGLPLALMSPLTFLTRPERWLWAIHYHRGTISGGPNFAYELCVRKIEPAQIEGLDLSSWRIAFNGAEAIQPKTLERFSKKFAPYGFRSETHFPVYGLAESTVCLATSPLNRPPRIDVIERDALEKEGRAVPVTEKNDKNILEFLACGKVMPEHEMRVVDDKDNVLPERHVGHLQFRGPSSMQGYYRNPEATKAAFHNGWWDTGDLAYLADEEVFITGRKKDVIIKAGRNLYPAELEDLTGQVAEIRKGCVIAFGVQDATRGTEKLVIVAETKETRKQQREEIIEKINEAIASAMDITPDQVVLVPSHTIPKTSSGKLQRSACKNMYINGKLAGQQAPAWLQLTKLSFSFAKIKIMNAAKNIAKFIYTSYAALLLLITIVPIWLSLWIVPKKIALQICRYWARGILFLVFCPIKIINKQNLYQHPAMIFTPNHASYVDAIVMLAVLPANTRFIGKSELLTTPFIRTFMHKLNFMGVDRFDSAKGIENTETLKNSTSEKYSLMIFPEGTFSYAEGLRPFKLGAFKIAAETNTPICPIALTGTRNILRGEEWLLAPHRITIIVCKSISPEGNSWHEITRLKNAVREEIAKYCGEPTLDFIVAGAVAERKDKSHE